MLASVHPTPLASLIYAGKAEADYSKNANFKE
jgi:hypothetical protein